MVVTTLKLYFLFSKILHFLFILLGKPPKWVALVVHTSTGQRFVNRSVLQKYLTEKKLNFSIDSFDFNLDDIMKQLQQIWEKFKLVKQVPTPIVHQKINPQSPSPKTTTSLPNLANIKKERIEKTNEKEDNSFPYMKFDFNEDPRTIASKMVEGVNVPGFGKPIPVRSFKMPNGWVKYVSVRLGGQNRGKWEPYVCELKTGKNFYNAAKLGSYLSESGSKHQIKEFDLTLDDNLRTLRLIWQKFKMPQSATESAPTSVVVQPPKPNPIPVSSPQTVPPPKDQKPKSYLDFNLNKKGDLIAEEMVEGVNIPGIDAPISIDCPTLPQGWKKFAQQKLKGTSKLDFDWIVYVYHMDSKKSIYNEIGNYFNFL